MTEPTEGARAESMLEHAGWIRALARHLVRDDELAKDLEQETWVRALTHPPRLESSARGWLATVMRNLARERRRGEARRVVRERRAARDERIDSSDAIVERAHGHRRLVEAVLALEEPYRTVLLLRYLDELAPAEIARRLQVPLPTVKTRLARGLDRLRQQLDRAAGGDRGAWLAWIAPLALAPAGTGGLSLTSALVAVLVVNVKIIIALLVLAATGVFVYIGWPSSTIPGGASPESRVSEPDSRAVARASKSVASAPSANRTIAAPIAPSEPGASAPVAAKDAKIPRRTRGRVIDVNSRAVAGVDVQHSFESRGNRGEGFTIAQGAPSIRTDDAGRFEIELLESGGTLVVQDAHHVTVFPAVPVDASTGREAIVVIAPRIEVSGRVIDESGAPVPAAAVRLEMPQMLRSQLAANLDFTELHVVECASDADGRFSLPAAAAVAGTLLRVSASGFPPVDEAAPITSEGNRTIVLRRPALKGTILAGRVVGASDEPIQGASVAFGLDVTKTDADGRFNFDIASKDGFNAMLAKQEAERTPGKSARAHGTLIAIKAGMLPARFEAPPGKEPGKFDWPEMVVLRLRGEPMSIAGRVVAPDGSAIAGADVWISDPTFFGAFGDPSAAESQPKLVHIENVLAGSDQMWQRVKTGADGGFRIDGLVDREYAIQAMESATLLRVEMPRIRAGASDVTIVMPRDEVYKSLRGRVLSKKGAPVAGVSVGPMCDAFQLRVNGETWSTSHTRAAGVTTDAEGRFELKTVPKNLVYLRLDSPNTLPLEWGRHLEGGMAGLIGKNPEDVTIRVDLRCHFQIELTNPDEADEIGILDIDGKPLEISEFRGRSRREGTKQRLTQGRSEKLAASDTAATIVLYREGVEVRRAKVELAPGDIKTVRP